MTSHSLDIGVFGARSIPSTYSGYETFLTTLLPELVARGHRVTMYCRRGETDGTGDYLGVRRVLLPAIPGKQWNTLSHGLIASLAARAAGHDVVFAVNVANAPFCAFHRMSNRPVVLNTDGQEWLRGKWGAAGRMFFKGSARVAGQCATALVSDCEAMADVYRDEFHAQSTVIPYCVPALDLRQETGVLERIGVTPRDYFIVGARLNPENNVDTIAEAYARSCLPLPLLVLGAANYDSPVADRLNDIATGDNRIRVLGHVDDRSEFFQLLGAARSYLHGHSVGGMNPSLVEAMHAGAYIAALDTPFNRETLGAAGRYFTLDSLATELGEVLAETDDEAQQMRYEAQSRAAARYSVAAVVDGYEELLISAAVSPSRGPVVVPTRWSLA
jgi:glycosyltransferase involved in cell wall biosynthesis